MKKSLLLALFGITTVATTSYGDGTILFSNYLTEDPPTINYANSNVPPGKAGLALGGSFAAELAWFNGVTTDPSQLTFVPGSLTWFSFNGPGSNNTADGDNTDGAGWYLGPTVTLNGSVMGSTVTLDVFAFNNGSLQNATIGGSSGLFQVVVGGGPLPPGTLINAPNFTVQYLIPEPSVFTLSGLGIAALVLFRRKTNHSILNT